VDDAAIAAARAVTENAIGSAQLAARRNSLPDSHSPSTDALIAKSAGDLGETSYRSGRDHALASGGGVVLGVLLEKAMAKASALRRAKNLLRDPGVPELTEALKARGIKVRQDLEGLQIYGENGSAITDLDVVTNIGIIQVKTGAGKGALGQALNTSRVVDLPVAVFDANKLVGSRKSFGPHVVRGLEKAGYEVTDDVDALIAILRAGGRR